MCQQSSKQLSLPWVKVGPTGRIRHVTFRSFSLSLSPYVLSLVLALLSAFHGCSTVFMATFHNYAYYFLMSVGLREPPFGLAVSFSILHAPGCRHQAPPPPPTQVGLGLPVCSFMCSQAAHLKIAFVMTFSWWPLRLLLAFFPSPFSHSHLPWHLQQLQRLTQSWLSVASVQCSIFIENQFSCPSLPGSMVAWHYNGTF